MRGLEHRHQLGTGQAQAAVQQQTQKQRQKLMPAVIQGVELLTMPLPAMQSYLAEAALGNPMLELFSPGGQAEAAPPDTGWEYGDEYGAESEYIRSVPRRREWMNYPGRDPEELFNLRGTMFGPDTLTGSLELQLSLCRLSPVEEAIGREIIGNLDERGYFVGGLPTICCYYQAPPAVGQRVLALIQSFVPRGIAARDVYECLCLQVEADCPYPEIARRIIREDLPWLAENQTARCARKYEMKEHDIQALFQYIRGLDPRPGNSGGPPDSVCYLIPDLIIRRQAGGFSVQISGEADDPLCLNQEYMDMLLCGALTREEQNYLSGKLKEAKALMKSVSIRHQTLRGFALALLRLQPEFFLKGPGYLRPLTMREMAGEMGVSISTVSRAAQDKYADTPWGIRPLKSFFTGSCGTDGGAVSVQAVKSRILALVHAQDPDAPLNDTQICAALQAEGYRISRRTVTKYRQALGLASRRTSRKERL